ncbi:hypothetical protein CONLIGDRAFT_686870 [Coniochaeta ligniaria NRRL 30616]|uniref:Uncharacterized protein n=1 Tax=Coniochaeta ligniaria NRRL 30616 TaxID=1408157 RepID=A0A1J7IPQ2_9PEZI|nr:hypothetical protein CONLIGDRAFT_686870 [Coniochaeta ligniaria NRRL 30616]
MAPPEGIHLQLDRKQTPRHRQQPSQRPPTTLPKVSNSTNFNLRPSPPPHSRPLSNSTTTALPSTRDYNTYSELIGTEQENPYIIATQMYSADGIS